MRAIWKSPLVDSYLLKKADAARRSGRAEAVKTWSRRSRILEQFVGVTFDIHAGGKHIPVTISEEMVGRKLGEFVSTRVQKARFGELAPTFAAARPTRRHAKLKKKSVPQASELLEFRPEIERSAYAPGARARAVLRGVEIAEEDLRSSGGAYDLEQVRRLLHNVSRQRVDRRVRDRSLLAVSGPSNKRHYPVVQFNDDGSVVEGLQATQNALGTDNGFAVLNFLIHPDRRLGGRRPIDLLRLGEVDIVVEAARRHGEQGA